MFVVYLTCYSGDKMPSLYIGSTTKDKIENGYHGSVSSKKWKTIWKHELQEHPELFYSLIIYEAHLSMTRQDVIVIENQFQKILDVVNDAQFINMAYAVGCFGTSFKGKIVSEETREKIRKANTGKVVSDATKQKIRLARKTQIITDETKNKISEANKIRVISIETRQKLSDINKGKIVSDETRQKLSNSGKTRTGEKNHMYGKVHTEETKQKIRDTKIGKKLSIDHKRKISENHKSKGVKK